MSRGCRRHKGTSGIEDILTFLKGTMVERSICLCCVSWKLPFLPLIGHSHFLVQILGQDTWASLRNSLSSFVKCG